MVRTRLAPSPSSSEKTLHLGNCRTALYAYLVAKKAGGVFTLRIENSDTARNVPGCAEGMLDDLHWLGLIPDEGYGTNNQPYGPYTQLEKLDRYKQMANYLLERGMAYKCVCSKELLDKQREEAFKRNPKAPFKYPGTCRNLKSDPDKNYVIRFKAPLEGETVHDDIVYNKITYPHCENYDWVIMREDGTALYNLAVVVDDIDMHITHVIRGRDHSGFNTLQQILFYKAFGANIPKFSHLCLVNNQEGKKLSKRDGAVSVKSVKALGYSPSAVLSYIAKLGWGHGNKEVFSLAELIELFDLKNCGKNDARFDFKKFAAINYEHLKTLSLVSDATYATHLLPFIQEKNIECSLEKLMSFVPLIRTRSKTLIEASNDLEPILKNKITIDPVASEKFLTPQIKPVLAKLAEVFSVSDWNEQSIRVATQKYLDEAKLTLKDIGQPLRVAIVGRTTSPELFQTMSAMDKNIVIDRIRAVL